MRETGMSNILKQQEIIEEDEDIEIDEEIQEEFEESSPSKL